MALSDISSALIHGLLMAASSRSGCLSPSGNDSGGNRNNIGKKKKTLHCQPAKLELVYCVVASIELFPSSTKQNSLIMSERRTKDILENANSETLPVCDLRRITIQDTCSHNESSQL